MRLPVDLPSQTGARHHVAMGSVGSVGPPKSKVLGFEEISFKEVIPSAETLGQDKWNFPVLTLCWLTGNDFSTEEMALAS